MRLRPAPKEAPSKSENAQMQILFALRHPGTLRAKGLNLDQTAKGLKPE
jgi:hypothetical protein